MFKNAKFATAILFMCLSILVDFTSTILSVLSDGMLVGVAIYLLWQMKEEDNKPSS